MLTKIFFKQKNITQFSAVQIGEGGIAEKVFLKTGPHKVDITQSNAIACQKPFCIAVCLTLAEFAAFDVLNAEVKIKRGSKTRSSLKLARLQTFRLDNAVLILFKIEKARCYQLNLILRYFLLEKTFKKNDTSVHERNIFAALYSFPRKIIVVSFKEDGYYNIFPMDFQCRAHGIYLLGLRTTNITLQKILAAKRLVVSNTGTAALPTILSLGAHHSKTPPEMDGLPFGVVNSRLFNFPVPAFSTAYCEVELTTHFHLGSHTLMVGRVVNEQSGAAPAALLCYMHFFQLQKAGYTLA